MKFLSRVLVAVAAVAAAASMALGVAAPSYAADTVGKPKPAGGFTYHEYWNWREQQNAYNLEVSNKVNPSHPGGTRTPATTGTGKVLEGRIMKPGEPMMIPEVMEPKPGAGSGLSKLLGAAGRLLGFGMVGMGGKATPPSNAVDIYRAQGLSESCIQSFSGCGADEYKKRVSIDACSLSNTCAALGAADSPQQIQPVPEDAWGAMTDQTDETPAPEDVSHKEWDSEVGCTIIPEVREYDGQRSIAIDYEIKPNAPRPPDKNTASQAYYDDRCTEPINPPIGYYAKSVCLDAEGAPSDRYGKSYGDLVQFRDLKDGELHDVCRPYASGPQPIRPIEVQFVQIYDVSEVGVIQKYSDGEWVRWVNPDPAIDTVDDTTITTSFDCVDPSGGVYSYSLAQNGAAGYPMPNCPPGTSLKSFDVNQSKGGATRNLGGATRKDGAMDAYPDCKAGGCGLEVYVDGEKCAVGRSECETWSQTRSKQPSRVQCKWGSYNVKSENCNALAEGYKTETGVIYDPKSDSMVAIDSDGNAVPDMNPTPWNPTNPNPSPGTSVGTSPGTGTGTGTDTGGSTFPTEGTNPDTQNCMAGAWSWNPVDWVLVPLKCAFIPQEDYGPKMTATKDALMAKPPMAWAVAPVGPGGSGCPDWHITLPGMSKNVVCDSSFTSAVVGSRGALFGLVSAAMLWPLIRSLWYASIPVLRAVPSK